jgi:hypothetical protein
LYHHQVWTHVFGWLLRGNISNRGHLRPRCNLFFFVFNAPFDGKNNGT